MSFSIQEALEFGAKSLNSERPRLESEILLAKALGVERIYLHTHASKLLRQEEFQTYSSFLTRAKNNEPIEYITQEVSFYDWEFEICSGVLIPRPESEILVSKCDELIKSREVKRVFELGVGSGIISISLALLNPHLFLIASDINPLALELTQRNIHKLSFLDSTLPSRIALVEGNVLEDKNFFASHSFEFFVSNPPYIASDYILPLNVAYEPREALFGGDRGDEILQSIISITREYKIPFLACEMGWDQKQILQDSLKDFSFFEFYQDLSGLDRGFVAKL